MIKIGICGHFGYGKKLLNGQTIKTKILYNELAKLYGKADVKTLDTHDWRNSPFKVFWNSLQLGKDCHHIIILPASNGIKVFAPLFAAFSKLYNINLHYIVIGGWLPDLLQKNKWLIPLLKFFRGIYVETNSMKMKLSLLGLNNVYILQNFKNLRILKPEELPTNYFKPFRFCTFSRVMKEKGIEDAIEAITKINADYNEVICHLDIYGQIDVNYKKEFEKIINKAPNYINYRGEVPFDQSVNVLKEYYALLFPTRFYTEGLPGTILDSYAAGLPIIASEWENAGEFIDNNVSGIIYSFNDNEGLYKSILKIIEVDNYNIYKQNCISKASEFLPEYSIIPLIKNIS